LGAIGFTLAAFGASFPLDLDASFPFVVAGSLAFAASLGFDAFASPDLSSRTQQAFLVNTVLNERHEKNTDRQLP